MITLDHLTLKNFFSHVDTELSLGKYEGLVLIEGQSHDGHYSSNGSGKSTLLEGIVYALTGDTLRGVSVNDVINRNYKKNTRVSLSLKKDGVPYSIDRYRKDDSLGDAILVHRDKENISKRVNKETQKQLEDILNIPYKILVSTILLGEGLSSRFTQLSDPEKKSLIESTLNLNYDLSKIRDAVSAKSKELKLSLAKIEGEVSVLEELSNIDIDILQDSIFDEKECIRVYEETLQHLREEYEKVAVEIEAIAPKIALLNEAINRYDSLMSIRGEKASAFVRQNEEMQKILSSSTPVCTLCKQELQSAETKNTVLSQYQISLDALMKDINDIDTELSKLPDRDSLAGKVSTLTSEHTEKSNRYRSLMQEYNSYSVKIVESQKAIESTEATIKSAADCTDQIEEKNKTIVSLREEIEKYEYFYKLFSPTGIVVNILSDAVGYINTRLATYSEVLLEKDYKIEFVKGKISLVDSKGSSYQSLSNGEKRRLDIAIQFSIHDYIHSYCGNSVDTMFIDEILDTLDDIGIENIITVLRLKLDYCKLSRIFVISHNSELKSYFDSVITVVKNAKGDSRVN